MNYTKSLDAPGEEIYLVQSHRAPKFANVRTNIYQKKQGGNKKEWSLRTKYLRNSLENVLFENGGIWRTPPWYLRTRRERKKERERRAKKKKKRDANVAEKGFQKRVRWGPEGLGANPYGVINQFSLINVIFRPIKSVDADGTDKALPLLLPSFSVNDA